MVLQLIVLSQRKYGKYSDFHYVILTFFKKIYGFFFLIDLFEFLAYSELIMLFMKCKDKKNDFHHTEAALIVFHGFKIYTGKWNNLIN